MIAQRSGVVVHIGSGAARLPHPAALAYAAAKAALSAYSKGLATAMAPHGIRVTTVNPGVIETSGLSKRLAQVAACLAPPGLGDVDVGLRTANWSGGHSPAGLPGNASRGRRVDPPGPRTTTA